MKIMKSAAVASVAAMMVLTSVACSSEESGSQNAASSQAGGVDPDVLTEKGTLTLCIDPEYAPLEYYKNGTDGEMIGFDVDAANALADMWGLQVKTVVTTFDGLLPGLQGGKCDMIPGGLTMLPERLEVFDAVGYMMTGPALAVNESIAEKVKSPKDLCGLSIGTQAATTYHKYVEEASEDCKSRNLPEVKLSEFPQTSGMVIAAASGKNDGLIDMTIAVSYMASQNPSLKIVEDAYGADSPIGMYVQKDKGLKQPLADALSKLEKDGTLGKLAEKYNLDPETIKIVTEI